MRIATAWIAWGDGRAEPTGSGREHFSKRVVVEDRDGRGHVSRGSDRDGRAGRTGSGREHFSKRDVVEDRNERGRTCFGAATSWRDAGISFAGDAGEREGAEDGSAAMLERRTALEFLSSRARRSSTENP